MCDSPSHGGGGGGGGEIKKKKPTTKRSRRSSSSLSIEWEGGRTAVFDRGNQYGGRKLAGVGVRQKEGGKR